VSDTHAVEDTRVTDEDEIVDVPAGTEVVGDASVGADVVEDVDDASDEDSEDDEDSSSDDEDDEDEDEDSEDGAEGTSSGTRSRRSSRGGESLRRLEEEGEVAADYLEELLDIVDLDGDIDIDVENGRASVAIVAEGGSDRELRKLVGPGGEVLEALQDLSRLAVQAKTGERSRLMLDVAGFRAARRKALEEQAARACEEVRTTSQPLRLEPMSAFERKVVHDVVADAGLVSESEGEDPARRVVIFPASA
jgi:spoIIIJ-associated protein